MSPDDREIAFSLLAKRCSPLLERWLSAPHMREWWGDPAPEFADPTGECLIMRQLAFTGATRSRSIPT